MFETVCFVQLYIRTSFTQLERQCHFYSKTCWGMQLYKNYQSIFFLAHAVFFYDTMRLQWATQGGVGKKGDRESGKQECH